MKTNRSIFNVRKAAQVAAYFAKQSGGTINVLKLTKLIYLADRQSLADYDAPILNDRFVSMNKGPLNSATYDRLKENIIPEPEWTEYLLPRVGHCVTIANPELTIDDLDELSRADLKIMEHVWELYGLLSKDKLVDITHDLCQEWVHPKGSSTEIPVERIFHCLGKPNSHELAEFLEEQKRIDQAFLG